MVERRFDTREVERSQHRTEVGGLSRTVVDLVEAPAGYLIYEVSAFVGFAGLWQTHGIDAARLYAEYVVQALSGSHERARSHSRSIPAY